MIIKFSLGRSWAKSVEGLKAKVVPYISEKQPYDDDRIIDVGHMIEGRCIGEFQIRRSYIDNGSIVILNDSIEDNIIF